MNNNQDPQVSSTVNESCLRVYCSCGLFNSVPKKGYKMDLENVISGNSEYLNGYREWHEELPPADKSESTYQRYLDEKDLDTLYTNNYIFHASFWLNRAFPDTHELVLKIMDIVFRDMRVRQICLHEETEIHFAGVQFNPYLFRSLVTQSVENTDTTNYVQGEQFYNGIAQHPELYAIITNETMLLQYVQEEAFWRQRADARLGL